MWEHPPLFNAHSSTSSQVWLSEPSLLPKMMLFLRKINVHLQNSNFQIIYVEWNVYQLYNVIKFYDIHI